MTGQPPRNSATKWTARLGLAGVSVIAAVVSYFHALQVVQAAGAKPPVAYLVPFLADLVILGASAALLDASRQDLARPPLATLALAVGIAVTLAMNVAAGVAHGLTGALVAGWPAVAFILALESLAAILRRGRDESGAPVVPATASHPEPPEPLTAEQALAALLASTSQRKLADMLGVRRNRVQAWAATVAADQQGEESNDGQERRGEDGGEGQGRPAAGRTEPADGNGQSGEDSAARELAQGDVEVELEDVPAGVLPTSVATPGAPAGTHRNVPAGDPPDSPSAPAGALNGRAHG